MDVYLRKLNGNRIPHKVAKQYSDPLYESPGKISKPENVYALVYGET